MYITNQGYTYTKDDGGQAHTLAPFLILLQHKNKELGPDNFRAIVRKVALGQLGNFMMGTARIKNHSIILSGTYGNNGLAVTTEVDAVYNAAVPVPRELYDKWANGSGWNEAGSEAKAMRDWAVKTFLENQ